MDPIDLGLNGARAVVVGAGFLPHRAGFGRGTVLNLARAGATVACIDISEQRAKDIAQEVVDLGGKAFPITADARDSAGIKAAIDQAADQLGGLDVAVDIVGTAWWSRSAEQSDADFDSAILTNLTQVFYTLKASVPHLIKNAPRQSAFVCLSSISSMGTSRYHAAYGAAKAGVSSLVRSFADEYGKYGLRVNAVAPGAGTHAPIQDPKQSAKEISDGVLFLASSLASRITGHTLPVDGGHVMAAVYNDSPEEQMLQNKPASYE